MKQKEFNYRKIILKLPGKSPKEQVENYLTRNLKEFYEELKVNFNSIKNKKSVGLDEI